MARPGCSTCGGSKVGLSPRSSRTSTQAFKVVDGDGECVLAVEGRCRVFADSGSATQAAVAALGASGWTVAPVLV